MKIIVNGLYLLAILAIIGFYRFSFLPVDFYQQIQFLVAFAIIGIIIMFSKLYTDSVQIKMNFGVPIIIMLVGWIISIIVCKGYHGQSYFLSLYSGNLVLYYSLYFFLHLFRFSEVDVIKIIKIVGFIALGLFYIQWVVYPIQIVDTKMILDRGTIRFFVGGMSATILLYFIYINRFLEEKGGVKSLILALLCFSVFVIQATRQIIFSLALITIINLIFSKRIKSKFFIGILISMSFVSVFFIFQDLFMEIFAVSQKQSSNSIQNIRVISFLYFLTDFQTDIVTYIFGNGSSHGSSSYGKALSFRSENFGLYLSDIGIIGDYVEYGLIFFVAGIVMTFKALFMKVSPGMRKYKDFIIYLLLTSFTSRGFLGNGEFVLISILYIIDLDRQKQHYQLIYQKIKNNA